MKQFLKDNTITYNLMSFTGFKSILMFSFLLEGPKSYKDLQNFFAEHEYLHENISIDALRIYINSLKEIGCEISKKNYDGITKYHIENHPFALNFSDQQVKSIIKVYKAISKSINVSDLIALQNFFNKISNFVANQELKDKLLKISPIRKIKPELVNDLIQYADHNAEVTIYYNSGNSGKKNITVLIDKFYISNGNLYISGRNSEYNNYSSFPVSKIIKIISVNMHNKILDVPELTVGYEYTKDFNENIQLLDCEKIVENLKDKVTIEMTSKNKFEIMQRILSHGDKCKVIYPQEFQEYILENLKKMKEGYFGR